MASLSEPRLLSLFARFDELGIAYSALPTSSGESDPPITDVAFDSRRVRDGALFCCFAGGSFDGHDFAAAATEAGASALLVERPLPLDVPQIRVEAVRPAMAHVAAAFFGHPSERIPVVGITGTNGKTTIAALLEAIARAAGWSATVIGTLSGARTTPEAPDLQRLLADSVTRGDDVVAMEVSSHSLDQARVAGTRFQVAVFSNLTEDHLDYHHTMEEYYLSKAALFVPSRSEMALINTDDPSGRRLFESTAVPARAFGSGDAEILDLTAQGAHYVWRDQEIDLPLTGDFNVLNAVAAAEVAIELGLAPDVIAAGLGSAAVVPGRFEVVAQAPFTVVVDYAHTPDGLRRVLAAAGALAGSASVIVVFGAGGDRDHAKRPLMGAAAAAGADLVVVTSDNPRSEDPGSIISEILVGMPADTECTVIEDRRDAIRAAVRGAGAGDILIIAGKGHETTQTIGNTVLDFDDRAVAREALAEVAS